MKKEHPILTATIGVLMLAILFAMIPPVVSGFLSPDIQISGQHTYCAGAVGGYCFGRYGSRNCGKSSQRTAQMESPCVDKAGHSATLVEKLEYIVSSATAASMPVALFFNILIFRISFNPFSDYFFPWIVRWLIEFRMTSNNRTITTM